MPHLKINNFLAPKSTRRKMHPRLKKYLTIAGTSAAIIVAIGGGLFFIYRRPAMEVYRHGVAAKDGFLKAQDQLTKQDFTGARQTLSDSLAQFTDAQQTFKKFRWLKAVPWLGNQISAIDNLLSAGINTGQSIQKVNDVANGIITPLQKGKDISLASLSAEQTRKLLGDIYTSKPALEEAQTSINTAVDYINRIPSKGIIKKIRDVVDPLKVKVPQLQAGIDQGIAASQIIPSVSGYPSAKTYLFLLQNNTEMRPTGGFIGTYGILKIKDGDITSFQTDNTYNLDKPAEAWLSVTPPWPLTRYNAVTHWFLRDANWSPDFPTAAQKTEWFYHQEKGPEQKIDGIIAVTPTFIQSLLGVTGDIKVNGLTFTSANLVDTLQYQVEQGFLRSGIAESDRKEIIGVLSKEILDSVLALPKSKWPDLWNIISKDITTKQIIMYVKDPYIQDLILKQNWGGEIRKTNGDYLSVIDANLASLKSDPGVKRTIDYTVRRDGNNFIADLKITYKNQGTITWKTTRYRTYTRVYVPNGAKLLKYDGAMVDCKLNDKGSIETANELDKTAFGTFICIEPGEERSLQLKYMLPNAVAKLFDNKTYTLLVQKQAGAAEFALNLNINLKKKIHSVKGIDNSTVSADNNLSINTTLPQDRELQVSY